MKKLFFLIFCLAPTLGYCAEIQVFPDYTALASACQKKADVECCLASVEAMKSGPYVLDTGKTLTDTTCPEGFYPHMMRCLDSYRWCIPVPAK